MSEIVFDHVTRYYGSVCAVADLEQTIHTGEFFSLLGPSGSGKTTVLRMTAGFLPPTKGVIKIDGRDVTGLPPERRDIGVVFQNYALFPHLTVFDNIAFGLRARKVPDAELKRRVAAVLERTGLPEFARRYPRELSGGEQQRVAVARALVIQPRVLLLDEPLGALDRLLREQMQYWIKAIQNETKVTTIYVTHDQVEALTMSDRVAVMHQGTVEQVGPPTELYRRPRTRFVASFMGDNNVLEGRISAVEDGKVVIETSDGLRLVAEPAGPMTVGSSVIVAVRPEEIRLLPVAEIPGEGNVVPGRVVQRVYRGPVSRYQVAVGEGRGLLDVDTSGREEAYATGDAVKLWWDAQSTSVVVQASSRGDM